MFEKKKGWRVYANKQQTCLAENNTTDAFPNHINSDLVSDGLPADQSSSVKPPQSIWFAKPYSRGHKKVMLWEMQAA